LIFTPAIVLLKWIPLIGFLLGGIAQLAAFLFALITGVTVSILVMSIAWLLFRPFLALTVVTLVSVCSFFLFYWDGTVPKVDFL